MSSLPAPDVPSPGSPMCREWAPDTQRTKGGGEHAKPWEYSLFLRTFLAVCLRVIHGTGWGPPHFLTPSHRAASKKLPKAHPTLCHNKARTRDSRHTLCSGGAQGGTAGSSSPSQQREDQVCGLRLCLGREGTAGDPVPSSSTSLALGPLTRP